MATTDKVTYSGPTGVYKPAIGDTRVNSVPTPPTSVYGSGYHDLDYIRELLDTLLTYATNAYTKCEELLSAYSLVIDPQDTDLKEAHDIAYPKDTSPGSVTFDEYKYLLGKNTSNASQYVISAYENNLRRPGGTNALDVSTVVLMINNETMRVKEFLDGYIGDLDDTAEHRTLELFQDWAEDATSVIQGFWKTLTGSITQTISGAELDQLAQKDAADSQAVLRGKINKINESLADNLAMLTKNWESTSSVFYAKSLGPALHFQTKVASNVTNRFDPEKMPILGSEMLGTLTGFANNYNMALRDQLTRNQMFSKTMRVIQLNIAQRDTYCQWIDQLSAISGISQSAIYTIASSIEQSDSILNADHPLSYSDIPNDYPANFRPNHSELLGLDDWDAHPQYLLRSGGLDSKIYGDVLVEDGVKIDGVDIDQHEHDGKDGSRKISGSNIEAGSISDEQIDTTANTPVPFNLKIVNEVPIISPIGETTVTVQIEFEISESNVSGYEFEIVELS